MIEVKPDRSEIAAAQAAQAKLLSEWMHLRASNAYQARIISRGSVQLASSYFYICPLRSRDASRIAFVLPGSVRNKWTAHCSAK